MLNIKKIFNSLLVCISLAGAAAALSSCDGAMYEGMEPCEVHNYLRFRWDHNLLWTDAFLGNVESVAVFAFDPDTEILKWKFSESGDALKQDGYLVNLDELPAGNYKFVAWCGLENDGGRPESFIVPYMTVGKSTLTELNCRMEREIDPNDATHHSRTDLYDLWHGATETVTLYDTDDQDNQGDHIYNVDLKKDTNRVRIILQQLSGEDVHPYGFTYTIEESNGHLNHDNSLLPDEPIIYHEHYKNVGYAGVDDPEDYPESGTRCWNLPEQATEYPTRTETQVKVAIADLTMSRLMADRKSYLTIKNQSGYPIVRIPLTDYALLVKDNYSKPMTDQEYLDRQDRYQLTFFLDKQLQWVSSSIIINSWRVVLNPDANFGDSNY